MIAMRPPRVVDQVQKMVAKPIARSPSRAMSWTPSRSGSAISARLRCRMSSSLGPDGVEVEIAAHERQQVVEVVLARRR